MTDLLPFVTAIPVEVRTPAGQITVTSPTGQTLRTYPVPAGFQLDRYLMSLYPDHTIVLSGQKEPRRLIAQIGTDDSIIETHTLTYQ